MLSTTDILKRLHSAKLLPEDHENCIEITEPKKLGVTNQYCTVSINRVPALTYRIAGQQWCCGFDRYTESYNIGIVEKSGVKTGIVYFDPSDGTQISTYSQSAQVATVKPDLHYAVCSLKQVHSSRSYMRNDYNVASMIWGAYTRVGDRYKQQFFSDLEPLFKRITFAIINDASNIVPSHNEPYPSNFTLGPGRDYRIVDWEYSGNNNRYWDLAFLSVTSKLTSDQDDYLLNEYFNHDVSSEELIKFYTAKAVVQFALMLWIASGLGKCNYSIDCDAERLQRTDRERYILDQCIQKMFEKIYFRASLFSSASFFKKSESDSQCLVVQQSEQIFGCK